MTSLFRRDPAVPSGLPPRPDLAEGLGSPRNHICQILRKKRKAHSMFSLKKLSLDIFSLEKFSLEKFSLETFSLKGFPWKSFPGNVLTFFLAGQNGGPGSRNSVIKNVRRIGTCLV